MHLENGQLVFAHGMSCVIRLCVVCFRQLVSRSIIRDWSHARNQEKWCTIDGSVATKWFDCLVSYLLKGENTKEGFLSLIHLQEISIILILSNLNWGFEWCFLPLVVRRQIYNIFGFHFILPMQKVTPEWQKMINWCRIANLAQTRQTIYLNPF